MQITEVRRAGEESAHHGDGSTPQLCQRTEVTAKLRPDKRISYYLLVKEGVVQRPKTSAGSKFLLEACQNEAETGTEAGLADRALTRNEHPSAASTPARLALGRLRAFSLLGGLLLRQVLALPSFLSSRPRAGLPLGTAARQLLGLLALVGFAVTDLQGWPSWSRVSSLPLSRGADHGKQPCHDVQQVNRQF